MKHPLFPQKLTKPNRPRCSLNHDWSPSFSPTKELRGILLVQINAAMRANLEKGFRHVIVKLV